MKKKLKKEEFLRKKKKKEIRKKFPPQDLHKVEFILSLAKLGCCCCCSHTQIQAATQLQIQT